jgi:hypothetical protein
MDSLEDKIKQLEYRLDSLQGEHDKLAYQLRDLRDSRSTRMLDWRDWSPTVRQSVSVAATATRARYCTIGKTAIVTANLAITGTGTVSNLVTVGNLPVKIADVTGNAPTLGTWWAYNGSSIDDSGVVRPSTASSLGFISDASGWLGMAWALNSNSKLAFTVIYEIA